MSAEFAANDVPPSGDRRRRVRVRAHRDGRWRETVVDDGLAEEVAIALVYGGISQAVMMATPTDLEDFALGFSLSEGLLKRPQELFSVEAVAAEGGLELRLHIQGERQAELRAARRTLAGPSGCGLCGKDSLAAAVPPLPAVTPRPAPSAAAVAAAQASLRHHQPLQARTGASHAAAWCDPDGGIHAVREDVGRHNALDKLIGALHRQRLATVGGFVLTSSRASYELVAKCARLDLGSLVSVSGATTGAAEAAADSGLNLIGFARDGRQVVYNLARGAPS